MDVETGTAHALRNFSEDNNSKRNKIIAGVGVGALLLGGAAVGVYFGLHSSSSSSSSAPVVQPTNGPSIQSAGARGLVINQEVRSNLPVVAGLTVGASGASVPAKINWATNANAVSPVKDQQQCGSCWAFAVAEAVESAYGLSTATAITPLSPQQLVACDTSDDGCNGGDPAQAIKSYLEKNVLTTEANYPYSSGSGTSPACNSALVSKVDAAGSPGVQVLKSSASVIAITPTEAALQAALVNGPVQVSIDASGWDGYQGKGAVIDGTGSDAGRTTCSSNTNSIDHAVQLVGYDTTAATPYWIVKNQWGTSWGNSGYIYLKMGSNVCCIACDAIQAGVTAITPTTTPTTTPVTIKPTTAGPTAGPVATTKPVPTTARPTTSPTTKAPTTAVMTSGTSTAQSCLSTTSVTNACYATAATISQVESRSFYCTGSPDAAGFYYCCFYGNGWYGSLSLSESTSAGKVVSATCKYSPSTPSLTTQTAPLTDGVTIADPDQCCSHDSNNNPYYCWNLSSCYSFAGAGVDSTGDQCSGAGTPLASGYSSAPSSYGAGC